MLCFTDRHVLLEDMFYLRVCNYRMACPEIQHVLLKHMFYKRAHLTGQFILQEGNFYIRTDFTGGCSIGSHV